MSSAGNGCRGVFGRDGGANADGGRDGVFGGGEEVVGGSAGSGCGRGFVVNRPDVGEGLTAEVGEGPRSSAEVVPDRGADGDGDELRGVEAVGGGAACQAEGANGESGCDEEGAGGAVEDHGDGAEGGGEDVTHVAAGGGEAEGDAGEGPVGGEQAGDAEAEEADDEDADAATNGDAAGTLCAGEEPEAEEDEEGDGVEDADAEELDEVTGGRRWRDRRGR